MTRMTEAQCKAMRQIAKECDWLETKLGWKGKGQCCGIAIDSPCGNGNKCCAYCKYVEFCKHGTVCGEVKP